MAQVNSVTLCLVIAVESRHSAYVLRRQQETLYRGTTSNFNTMCHAKIVIPVICELTCNHEQRTLQRSISRDSRLTRTITKYI